MRREYNGEFDDEDSEHSDDSQAPDLVASRADFQAMVDDFIDNFDISSRKMKPKPEGETPLGSLAAMRQALRSAGDCVIIDEGESEGTDDILDEDKEERWDCETILSLLTPFTQSET